MCMIVHTAISCNHGPRDNVCKHWTWSSPLYITVLVTHHHLLQTVWWGQSSWMAVLPSQGLICSGCRCLCDNGSFGMVLSFCGKNKGNPDLRTSHWRVPTWHFPTFLDLFFFSPEMTCCHKNQSLRDLSYVLLLNLSFESKTNLEFLFVCFCTWFGAQKLTDFLLRALLDLMYDNNWRMWLPYVSLDFLRTRRVENRMSAQHGVSFQRYVS